LPLFFFAMSEQTSLTLFFAIAALALIGAVNSRGMLRAIISYTLAFACLVLAIFHTYHYVSRQSAAMDLLTTPAGASPDVSTAVPADTDGLTAEERAARNLMAAQNQSADQGQNQAQDQVQGDQGQDSNPTPAPATNPGSASANPGSMADLRKIERDARRLQGTLSAINLSGVAQMSDAEYTRIQAGAKQAAAEAQALQTRMATLAASPPVGQDESLQTLTNAIGYLVSASRDLERFFNSENTADEKMHSAGFRNGVQAAGVALQRVESRMGGD